MEEDVLVVRAAGKHLLPATCLANLTVVNSMLLVFDFHSLEFFVLVQLIVICFDVLEKIKGGHEGIESICE
jgi:hypothetical protein